MKFLLTFCAAALIVTHPLAQALTADDIVAKNLEAKGGADLLTLTQTVKMSGKVTGPNGVFQMTVWAKRPDRKRIDSEKGDQKITEAFDGASAWVRMDNMPPQTVPAGPQLEGARRQAEFDTGLLNYKQKGISVALASKEPVGGAYHLRVVAKDGTATDYYIDAKTGLEQRIVTTIAGGPRGRATMEMRFSDYRRVEGRMVPFVVENVVDGKPLAKTELDKIEFNLPIEDSFFKLPR
jgi:outer membrane lipoprotein-sorting protein